MLTDRACVVAGHLRARRVTFKRARVMLKRALPRRSARRNDLSRTGLASRQDVPTPAAVIAEGSEDVAAPHAVGSEPADRPTVAKPQHSV